MTTQRGLLSAMGAIAGVAALAFWVGNLQAKSDGVSGKAQSAQGCSCHSTSPNANGVVTVSISGPQVVQPGATNTYTVSVSGGPAGTTGGLDLAKTGGTFVAGTGTRLLDSDLVHADETRRSWTFQWTAPAVEGTYNLYAVGMSSNGSGTGGDSWNWYGGAVSTPFAISVNSLVGTGEPAPGSAWLGAAAPNPTSGGARLEFAIARPGPVRLEVFNASGRRVATLVEEELPAGRHWRTWDGRGRAGSAVPSGQYLIRLSAGGTTLRRAVLLLH